MRIKLTEGPMEESEMLAWAQRIRAEIDRHWDWHKDSDPGLSGAQLNFLIEMERAIERYVRYCDEMASGSTVIY